ncbi:MAG: SAM-dependent methyltransferase [Bernardetiaceae bacterium]|nr:SAM-dependent methyltransferase [Bernardetiaceae bacterium]
MTNQTPTLDAQYWQQRYEHNQTKWDIGHISTPLQKYFDTLEDKNLRILIPGAGNAYEAEYLHQKGFTQIYVLDLAQAALTNLASRCPSFPKTHLLQEDFFCHNPAEKYDIIIEQTFFCALNPNLRKNYVSQMLKLLKPKTGKLVGLLFADVLLERSEPPFGAKREVYEQLFSPYFQFVRFEPCSDSIEPRAGSELFIEMIPST